ncbi:F-box protein [Quillaja saponaria]|uniref:F-box protein n=1 Tax=Quillaja saponaria TaxID=32244 RepID=A0AAD7QCN7_QUISA|nr:F-box protein [Quillaja saponaria]
MMNYIPKDILYNIFLLLPVPALVRFKSLNKSWHAEISSRAFAREHLHRYSFIIDSPTLILLICNDSERYLGEALCIVCSEDAPGNQFPSLKPPHFSLHPPLSDVPKPLHVDLIGSTDGLLCFSIFFRHAHVIRIWNPSIRKWWDTPHPSYFCQVLMRKFMLVGFSRDPNCVDDYKVVLVTSGDHHERFQVCLYSLKTNKWRSLDDVSISDISKNFRAPCNCNQVNVGGSIFWLLGVSRKRILFFDMADDVFGEIEVPLECRNTTYLNFGASNKFLSLFLYHTHSDRYVFDLWVMKDINIWTKQYSISLVDRRIMYPVGCTDSGKLLIREYPGGFVFFDTKRQVIQDFGIDFGRLVVHCHVTAYKESSVPVSPFRKTKRQRRGFLNWLTNGNPFSKCIAPTGFRY